MISNAVVDVSVSKGQAGDRFQFKRIGYFTPDYDSTPDKVGGGIYCLQLVMTFCALDFS